MSNLNRCPKRSERFRFPERHAQARAHSSSSCGAERSAREDRGDRTAATAVTASGSALPALRSGECGTFGSRSTTRSTENAVSRSVRSRASGARAFRDAAARDAQPPAQQVRRRGRTRAWMFAFWYEVTVWNLIVSTSVQVVLSTIEFEEQETPLSKADLRAMWTAMHNLNAFAFFNCGYESGARCVERGRTAATSRQDH